MAKFHAQIQWSRGTKQMWSHIAGGLKIKERGALGRGVEHSTADHWVPGSKPGVFKSGALSSFILLPGVRPITHKTLAVKK